MTSSGVTRSLLALLLLACGAGLGTDAKLKRSEPSLGDRENKVYELQHLQEAAKDGVIQFDDQLFSNYAGGRNRPYSLVFFLTAAHLLNKPNLHLRDLRAEFGFMADSYRKHHAGDADADPKLFFAEMEFMANQQVFQRLGINSLPHVFRLPPSTNVGKDGTIKLKDDDAMKHGDYSKYPWTADDFASFVLEKTGIPVGPIERPSLFKSPLFPFLALGFLGSAAYIGYNLYYAAFMKNLIIWVLGCLFVYWFSVSGGMHNIIRGVPMAYPDPESGKLVMFMNQGQSQLGAEGFIMGSLYTTCGLAAAAITYLCPKLKDPGQQRIACYVLLVTTLWCVTKIVSVYTWKTGYHLRWYLMR
ncbi:hypothetical protein WJX72_003054 [[Myrmecia] bisecta]|uniref:Dolichyl-diphosphooligosaccharide--protein glycosyltransferase subunit 3 n=1 Tax=[Myrmecia] bisecta TaxID=41462 RepID=A0AAW1Q6R9_9CHLO